jgi:hypothetical protein
VLVENDIVDGQLVDMDPLLDPKLGLGFSDALFVTHDDYVERGVQHTRDPTLAHNRAIFLGQVVYQHAQV